MRILPSFALFIEPKHEFFNSLLVSNYREEDVENEAATEDLLYRNRQNVDVGSVAKGESQSSIARHFGRGHSSVQRILGETGGIRPAQKRRSRLALTLSEREEISRGLAQHLSMRGIACTLGRSASTVSREIRRNGGRRRYRASKG